MTLAELIQRAGDINKQVSTAWIPLKLDGQNVNITFKLDVDKTWNYVINLKIEKK